jgi:hypothetical protein
MIRYVFALISGAAACGDKLGIGCELNPLMKLGE